MGLKIPPSSRVQEALDTPFDNENNGFLADNVQDAILEARETAPARFTLTLTHNGTVNNNTYFGYTDNIPGDDSPIILPLQSNLSEFTFTNARSNADFDLEFRINALNGPTFLTVSRTNTQFFFQNNFSQIFNPGDAIYIKYKDRGTNAQDVAITLYFEVT